MGRGIDFKRPLAPLMAPDTCGQATKNPVSLTTVAVTVPCSLPPVAVVVALGAPGFSPQARHDAA